MIPFLSRFRPVASVIKCPECSIQLRRQHRHGILQNRILPFFGYFPWECPVCRETLYFCQRRRKRIVLRASAHSEVLIGRGLGKDRWSDARPDAV